MNYLLLTFKNIEKLIKNKPLLYIFLIASQIVCIIAVLLICGLVNNAYEAEHEIMDAEKSFQINLADYSKEHIDEDYTEDLLSDDEADGKKTKVVGDNLQSGFYDENCYVKNVTPKLNELIDFLGDDFYYISLWGSLNSKTDSLSFTAGMYSSDFVWDSEELEQFKNSNEYILRLDPEVYEEDFGKVPEVGDKLNINGIDYTVRITEKDVAALSMPYAALQDVFLVSTVYIGTKDICTPERNEEIQNKLGELFGYDKELTPPIVRDLQEQQNIYMIYIITAAVIVMILLNMSRVYSYVLSYRKKAFSVMSICGASRFKIFIIYFIELILTLVVTYSIGAFIFNAFILPQISITYPSFLDFMTFDVYRNVFCIYIVAALIIMSIVISTFISRSVMDMERSGK